MSDQPPLLSPTELIHLTYDGNFMLECEATVLSCQIINATTTTTSGSKNDQKDNNMNNDQELQKQVALHLDRTVMHPQGGGQPSDIGVIEIMIDNNNNGNGNDGKTAVSATKVTVDRASGVVTHVVGGVSSSIDLLQVGQPVRVLVDPEVRRILSECHTAGHVVDSAMAQCGRILPPVKGYHFLDGPYVEYKGSIPLEERDELLVNLQRAFADLVEQDISTVIETMSKTDAIELCQRVQQQQPGTINLDEFGNEVRMVTVAGWCCPCGGTHVRSTSDLRERKWGIVGIKCKKGVVRVKYDQNTAVAGA
jgi:Ser-tRNA(Ala) deacylase AlaX